MRELGLPGIRNRGLLVELEAQPTVNPEDSRSRASKTFCGLSLWLDRGLTFQVDDSLRPNTE
jgi:hypothetical protein